MKKIDLELAVGIFLIIGIACMAYITIKLGKLEIIGGNTYSLFAEFEKAGGVKNGSAVEIAGVEIGRVKKLRLGDHYQAIVELSIRKGVNIQDDAIVSVKTKGLIGEKYIEITPGGSDKILTPGDKIRETESAIDFEEIISKYVFGKV